MITAVDYQEAQHREIWNDLVRCAKNGTFLHTRDFLDYHGSRFADRSVVLLKNGKPWAIMPAHHNGNSISSHSGLSYGGIVWPAHVSYMETTEAWAALVNFYFEAGFHQLEYRPAPTFVHRQESHDDAHSLYELKAKLVRTTTHSIIDLQQPMRWQQRRVRGVKAALRAGIGIENQSDRWHEFWPILEARLYERANVKPVHTLSEITFIVKNFPDQVQLWLCTTAEGAVLGGVVFFVHDCAVNAQYIASNALGRESRAMDLLFGSAIEYFSDKRFLGLGTSHWPHTGHVNEHLKAWKESWGTREHAQNYWEVPLKSFL